MATMVTDMALRSKNAFIAIALLTGGMASCFAKEFVFTPSISLNEVYTNNINLSATDKEHSFVTQPSAILTIGYESQKAQLNVASTHTYNTYSHDSELDETTRTLAATGNINLTDHISVNSSATVKNINRNIADNSPDDLVTNNTIESKDYSLGINYTFQNSSYSLNSSTSYSIQDVEDDIGDNHSYNISYSTQNGNAARNVFWNASGSYRGRENDDYTGDSYTNEIILGWISPYKFTPFVRYFAEDTSGNISTNVNAKSSSWGPGLRWKISKHLILDTSYNYTSNDSESSDYVASNLEWQPSSRTKLTLNYSKRFFGESYGANFTNTSKRLTNTFSYQEELTAFDRNRYELGDDDDLELIENNEFDLTKTLRWGSNLKLSRTTFSVNVSHIDRESLESGNNNNKTFTGDVSAKRNLTRNSSVKLDFSYRNQEFNQGSSSGNEQIDYYRIYSTTYSRQLLHSLSMNYMLQYTNRSSSNAERNYDETRASITINKEF